MKKYKNKWKLKNNNKGKTKKIYNQTKSNPIKKIKFKTKRIRNKIKL